MKSFTNQSLLCTSSRSNLISTDARVGGQHREDVQSKRAAYGHSRRNLRTNHKSAILQIRVSRVDELPYLRGEEESILLWLADSSRQPLCR